jgi:polysaccharide biosynthesis protein PslH
MKILFLAARFPYPPIQGDRVRAYYQLRHLGTRHAITLVAPEPDSRANFDAALAAIRPYCTSIETVPVAKWERLGRLLRTPFTRLPLQTLYFCLPAIEHRVRQLLSAQVYDLAHVQMVRMAPVELALGRLPKVLDLIDALSVNMRRRAERQRGPLSRLAAAEAGRIARYERELPLRYDRLLISSDSDRAAIGNYPNLHVVPNGVEVEAHTFSHEQRQPGLLVFSGTMRYFPNADAAIWFARHVFPMVRRQIPEARLLIVGADPPKTVQRLARTDGIRVTGFVPSTQAYLLQATAAVAPMQAGSGMQFKVIEAMACGTPVIATPLGIGGLAVEPGRHVLVADTAEAFTQQLVRLMRDVTLQRELANNARKLVEERYSWTRSVAALEEIYALACSPQQQCHVHTAA